MLQLRTESFEPTIWVCSISSLSCLPKLSKFRDSLNGAITSCQLRWSGSNLNLLTFPWKVSFLLTFGRTLNRLYFCSVYKPPKHLTISIYPYTIKSSIHDSSQSCLPSTNHCASATSHGKKTLQNVLYNFVIRSDRLQTKACNWVLKCGGAFGTHKQVFVNVASFLRSTSPLVPDIDVGCDREAPKVIQDLFTLVSGARSRDRNVLV